ncbi:DUF6671 family protein [Synechococcus sp. CCY 9618]|uniref:DUF6671 family protein n=1 Tax=Synechococcus sp. CCY 9618 TaxID=2815602 RepID=UPI001C21DAC1|nr:DUF6671 family protein [Synechococcus sp. CCY 9618]
MLLVLSTAVIGPPGFDGLAPYAGRCVALATCHGKERVLARPFRRALNLTVVVATGCETDRFGTFSGERPRPSHARETCRRKAEAGLAHTGLDLGLASEGSFGPHPAFPWLAAGVEWLTFIDRRADLVIEERLIAPRTNFDQRLVAPADDIGAWLGQVGFPSHALIARPHRTDGIGTPGSDPLIKGIRDPGQLALALRSCAEASPAGLVRLETDMRAHCNPTRLRAIRTLAFRLVRRIASPCPACGAPGWGLMDRLAGLPCGWCGGPTEGHRVEVRGCVACGHRLEAPRADGRRWADPGDCTRCNP